MNESFTDLDEFNGNVMPESYFLVAIEHQKLILYIVSWRAKHPVPQCECVYWSACLLVRFIRIVHIIIIDSHEFYIKYTLNDIHKTVKYYWILIMIIIVFLLLSIQSFNLLSLLLLLLSLHNNDSIFKTKNKIK